MPALKDNITSQYPHSSTPKVAIIIPFYNVEKYLKDCLDSVIHQSYENVEIILVDDGSSDKSIDIAKEYFKKDSRISLICKSNGGQGSARNAGIEYLLNGYELNELMQSSLDSTNARQKSVDSSIVESRAESSDFKKSKSARDSKASKDSQYSNLAESTFIFKATLKETALSHNAINYLTGEKLGYTGKEMDSSFLADNTTNYTGGGGRVKQV